VPGDARSTATRWPPTRLEAEPCWSTPAGTATGGTERYGTGNPFLTAAAADWLVEQQAELVGIDSLNIDDTSGPSRPVHTALLAAGIPIVEHLCGLDQLPPNGFRFHAAPPQVVGIGTFPVRAYAVLAALLH
jgi:arylformamidase